MLDEEGSKSTGTSSVKVLGCGLATARADAAPSGPGLLAMLRSSAMPSSSSGRQAQQQGQWRPPASKAHARGAYGLPSLHGPPSMSGYKRASSGDPRQLASSALTSPRPQPHQLRSVNSNIDGGGRAGRGPGNNKAARSAAANQQQASKSGPVLLVLGQPVAPRDPSALAPKQSSRQEFFNHFDDGSGTWVSAALSGRFTVSAHLPWMDWGLMNPPSLIGRI
jgi:hypothetical protein